MINSKPAITRTYMYSKEVIDLEIRTIRNKIDLYEQLKEQLIHDVERYRKEGRDELAGTTELRHPLPDTDFAAEVSCDCIV